MGRRNGHMAVWQRLLFALMIVSFCVQSYVTQTHIHLPPSLEAGIPKAIPGSVAVGAADQNRHDRYPANEDPANCPLCQEMVYAGHYIAPAAIAFLLPPLGTPVVATVRCTFACIYATSHSWQGRAPPAV
jgi:hypothetical protein